MVHSVSKEYDILCISYLNYWCPFHSDQTNIIDNANNHTPPHFEKLPAVTHIFVFQSARKMKSRRCIVAEAVSAKKQLHTTL